MNIVVNQVDVSRKVFLHFDWCKNIIFLRSADEYARDFVVLKVDYWKNRGPAHAKF